MSLYQSQEPFLKVMEKSDESGGSRNLQVISKLLSRIEQEREDRLLIQPDEKVFELEDSSDQLWTKGDFSEFARYCEAFLSVDIEQQLRRYFDIIGQTSDPELPFIHLNEGRRYLFSMMRNLHIMGQRLTELGEVHIGALAWLMRLYYYLGENFEKIEDSKAASQRFLIYLKLWLGLSMEKAIEQQIETRERFLAWNCPCDARIELLKVLNSLGIDSCSRSQFWEGIGYFKRAQFCVECPSVNQMLKTNAKEIRNLRIQTIYYLAQAYAEIGATQLGFRYCAEVACLQRSHLIEQIENIISPTDCRQSEASTTLPSTFLCTLTSWVDSIEKLSEFFSNRYCYASAELLLHSAESVVKRLRSKGPWGGREISELEAVLSRDLAHCFAERIKISSNLMSQPEQALAALEDAADEFKRRPCVEIESSDNEVPFSVGLSQLQFKASHLPSDSEDLCWDFQLTSHFSSMLPETVDIPKEEESTWIPLSETFAVTGEYPPGETPSNRARVEIPLVGAGTVIIMLSEVLYFDHGEEVLTCARLNSPIIACEYKSESGTARDLHGGVHSANPISPLLCLHQEGLHQLQRVVNHYVDLALKYFKLDGWVGVHVRIVLLQSSAYRHLTICESDPKTFGIIQNRRLKLLSPLLEELSPTHYNNFISLISFECGEICQELLSLKMTNRSPLLTDNDQDDATSSHLNPKAVRSIHEIRRQGIRYYSLYLASLKNEFGGRLPDSLHQRYWDSYFATRFATMQFLSTCNRFVGRFEPPAASMEHELSEALEICNEIRSNAIKWGGGEDNPACGAAQFQLANCMADILPEGIRKIKLMAF